MESTEKASIENIEQLVEASQAGERGAFDKIVTLYQRRTMQLAINILGNSNDAAEAVQNAFVKAYLNINKLKIPARFESWLLKIVANQAVSQLRIANRRPYSITEPDYLSNEKASLPENDQIENELQQAIQSAMSKLTEKEAKAISLFSLEDLPHRQVAKIMGCSTQAARWHVFRARQKLKVLLKDYLK